MKTSSAWLSPCIETLEARIAPASVLVYTDLDGDQVRISSTRGDLAGHATFDVASDHHQLQTLDLTDHSFNNTSITVQVRRVAGGDGQANIGYINATGNDLGRVAVSGDLGRISAGDGNAGHVAIAQLSVRSMGALSTSTQAGGTPLIDLGPILDTVTGLLGSTTEGITGTLPTILEEVGSLLQRPDLSASTERLLTQLVSDGETLLSTVTGQGGDPSHLSGNFSQLLATLRHDLQGVSGLQVTAPGLLSVDLSTLLNNADGQITPILSLDGSAATVAVNLTGVLGGLLGSSGSSTAAGLLHHVGTTLGGLTSGVLTGLPPDVANLLGNAKAEIGHLTDGTAPVTPGSLHDLALLQSTLASALSIPGEVTGAALPLLSSLLHNLTDLLGNSSSGSGTGGAPALLTSDVNGDLGQLRVSFDVDEIFLNVHGNIGQAFIGGSLLGGHTPNSGEIFASGNLDRLTINGHIVGGDNLNTGLVQVNGRTNGIAIGGTLLGGSGTNSAAISLQSDVQHVVIRGDVTGHDGMFSGSVINGNGSIRALLIRGALISGADGSAASLSATDSLGSLSIGKGVFADATHRAAISATGTHSQHGRLDRAFGSIAINGSASDLDIMAGYDLSLNPLNGSAGIGSVVVRGDVTGTNIIAGIMNPGGGNNFGDGDDRVIAMRNENIVSRISSILVRGNVFGTPASGDHFGIEASQIDRVNIYRGRVIMEAGAGNDDEQLSEGTGDVTVREVTAA